VSWGPSAVSTTAEPEPSPDRPGRRTRTAATRGSNASATAETTWEYASSASWSVGSMGVLIGVRENRPARPGIPGGDMMAG
jgi:hypothetical protein